MEHAIFPTITKILYYIFTFNLESVCRIICNYNTIANNFIFRQTNKINFHSLICKVPPHTTIVGKFKFFMARIAIAIIHYTMSNGNAGIFIVMAAFPSGVCQLVKFFFFLAADSQHEATGKHY